MPLVCSKRLTLSLGLAALAMTPAAAELPPQYTVWQNFSAIAAQSEIPEKLGIVDRIERTKAGYRIRGGQCWIDAVVVREMPKGPGGQPMVGASRVASVKLGDKTCK